MKLITCPVCKKKYLPKIALKNHIINSAMGEVWRWYRDRKKKKPHNDYFDKNYKSVKIKKLQI